MTSGQSVITVHYGPGEVVETPTGGPPPLVVPDGQGGVYVVSEVPRSKTPSDAPSPRELSARDTGHAGPDWAWIRWQSGGRTRVIRVPTDADDPTLGLIVAARVRLGLLRPQQLTTVEAADRAVLDVLVGLGGDAAVAALGALSGGVSLSISERSCDALEGLAATVTCQGLSASYRAATGRSFALLAAGGIQTAMLDLASQYDEPHIVESLVATHGGWLAEEWHRSRASGCVQWAACCGIVGGNAVALLRSYASPRSQRFGTRAIARR